jgi:Tfp pilus assembly protein PilN
MPAQKKSSVNINLLPKDPFSQSEIGKLLNWALSTGRYIVVFTEMIVILTFLSRFTLDRQLTDLNERLFEKQAVLDSYKEFEAKIRSIQQQAQSVESIALKIKSNLILGLVKQMTPEDILFSQISVRGEKFTITGTAFSTISLSQYVNLFKSDPRFTDVVLEKISSSDNDVGINFTLSATALSTEPTQNNIPIPSPSPGV